MLPGIEQCLYFRLTLVSRQVSIVSVIKSFRCDLTERIFRDELVRKFPLDFQRTARRKLIAIDRAQDLNDLRVPPGNHLERLRGDRAGQYSIRINAQWRICFRWDADGAKDVEIVDYH